MRLGILALDDLDLVDLLKLLQSPRPNSVVRLFAADVVTGSDLESGSLSQRKEPLYLLV